MNTYNAECLVMNLPDCYKKTEDSNNAKILEIEAAELTKIRKDLSDVETILDLENATGKTLDLYGLRVGQARGEATDEQYRVMIKAKVMRNLSNGSLPSVLEALSVTFGCDKSEIQINEAATPCTMELVALPISKLTEAGFTLEQSTALVKSLFPVGIAAESLIYAGTFEFSDREDEYDENAGFTDAEGGTKGGYFGHLAGDGNDIVLPI